MNASKHNSISFHMWEHHEIWEMGRIGGIEGIRLSPEIWSEELSTLNRLGNGFWLFSESSFKHASYCS